MPLQIRRGTQAEREALTVPPADGELVYEKDTGLLYIGDGVTQGGNLVVSIAEDDVEDLVANLFENGEHVGISYSAVGGQINSTVNFENYQGVIRASAFKGSLVADDSTLLVDGINGLVPAEVVSGTFTGNVIGNVTGNLTGEVIGNTTGYHTGDITGSVFSDDSTVLVNGVNSSLNTTGLTIEDNSIVPVGKEIEFGSPTKATRLRVWQTGLEDGFLNLTGSLTESGDSPWMITELSRGSNDAPEIVQQNDLLSGILFKGYDGNNYIRAATIAVQVDEEVVNGSEVVPGKVLFVVQSSADGAGPDDNQFLSFNSKGVLSVPVVQTGSFTTGNLPSSPVVGMIIYNTSTNKFQGYQNTNGTTPEWVDLS